MGKKFPEQLKWIFINHFPGLATDNKFEITSPADPNYNCISWAMMRSDRWTATPAGYPHLDGVYWWPPGAEDGRDISCLIDAFRHEGFELCQDYSFEEEWLKVALYYNPNTNEWTHAARQLRSGLWASKLGESYDIHHGSPYTLESNIYGRVYCIMRAPFHSHKK